MDKIIALNFGNSFKNDLLRKADSLFVESNPTVYYADCDTLPRLADRSVSESTEMKLPTDKKLLNHLKRSKYGYYPQIDIGFNIDTAGNANHYFLSQFYIYDNLVENNKYKDQLLETAFAFVKQFKVWKPGIVSGKKVQTAFIVRLSLVAAKN
jgi:hypothetical protein